MFALLFMTTFLRTSIDTTDNNHSGVQLQSGMASTSHLRPQQHPSTVRKRRRTGQQVGEDTDDGVTAENQTFDGILPGLHNPPLEKFRQDAGGSATEDFGQSNNSPQLKDIVANVNLDLYGAKSSSATDWRSLLQKHHAMMPDDARQLGPRSAFVQKLFELEDQLMLKANGTVFYQIQEPKMPSNWRSHLARTPSDQFIEFLPPILPFPLRFRQLNNTQMVVLVLSHQGSFIKRQAIRETWAKDHANVLFVVAQSDCADIKRDVFINSVIYVDENGKEIADEASKANKRDDEEKRNSSKCNDVNHNFLRLEQQQNQDLLEIPMKERYTRLPEKLLQSYHWVIKNVPQVEWIVKSDDDMFVRVDNLNRYLKKYNSNIPMVLGDIVYHSEVNPVGKWAELDYRYVYYPYWPKGSAGHVVSRAAASYFSDTSESLRRYQGEDTSIGIWLDDAQKNQTLKDVTYIHSKSMFASHGKNACMSPKTMIIGHDMSPDALLTCYQNFTFGYVERAWLDDASGFEEIIEQEMGNAGPAPMKWQPAGIYKREGEDGKGSTTFGLKGTMTKT